MVLHLPEDISGHACAVKVLLSQCPDSSPKVKKGSKPLKLESDGTTLTQVNAICKAIAREFCPTLIGTSASETAQVRLHCCLHSTSSAKRQRTSPAACVTWPSLNLGCISYTPRVCTCDLQVEQWMSFVHTRFSPATDDALLELNDVLSKRVFLVNNRLSLADICLYAALSDSAVCHSTPLGPGPRQYIHHTYIQQLPCRLHTSGGVPAT